MLGLTLSEAAPGPTGKKRSQVSVIYFATTPRLSVYGDVIISNITSHQFINEEQFIVISHLDIEIT
jgi:hypothetical protein